MIRTAATGAEHQRKAAFLQQGKQFAGEVSQSNDDSFDSHFTEDLQLGVYFFAGTDHAGKHSITVFDGSFARALQQQVVERTGDFFCQITGQRAALSLKSPAERIGHIVHFTGGLLDFAPSFLTDLRTVLESHADCGCRYSKPLCNIFDRYHATFLLFIFFTETFQ